MTEQKIKLSDVYLTKAEASTYLNVGNVNTKEDISNKVTTLDTNTDHYPNCPAVNSGLGLKEDLSNKVTTLDNSLSHFPTTSAIEPLVELINDLISVSITPNYTTVGGAVRIGGVVNSNMNNLILTAQTSVMGVVDDTKTHNISQGTTTIDNLLNRDTYRTTLRLSVKHSPTNKIIFCKSYTIGSDTTGTDCQ